MTPWFHAQRPEPLLLHEQQECAFHFRQLIHMGCFVIAARGSRLGTDLVLNG
jgi:hypothetical protein